MLISHKLKLIFVHIPKTGGTSYRRLIQARDPNAAELEYFHSPMTKKVSASYPDTRNLGLFEIPGSSAQVVTGSNLCVTRQKAKMTFKEWLLFKHNSKIENDWPFPMQHLYLQHGCEAKPYEKLKVAEKAHYYGDYNYMDYYKEQENIDIVYELCAKDIELYGFTFEPSHQG